MKIAQVAPLYESVPPKYYGGTERVVSYLTEELVEQGHDVTLFASGDSSTKARLVPITPVSLRLDKNCVDQLAHHIHMLEQVYAQASTFDVVHFHIDYLHFLLSRRMPTPNLTTLHGRLDIPDLRPLYREFREMPLVSISNSQRTPLKAARWEGTVYHGLPHNLFTFRRNPGDYLVFLGRISPEKGLDTAIKIAKRAGMRLKIASKIDNADRAYFEREIKTLLNHPLIEFLGEVDEKGKNELLGHAYALLFPINWPEPFGLVMIEAMACGTPIIAFDRGSVREVMEDGVSGYIVDTAEAAVEALKKIPELNRERVHKYFLNRFTVMRMAAGYVKIYERILAGGKQQPVASSL